MSSRYTREIHTPAPAGNAIGTPWRYQGGKGGSGVAQTIINVIPPHDLYIEAFVGGGAIFRKKRRSASSILIDQDPAVVDEWRRRTIDCPDVTVLQGDALELVPSLLTMAPGAFVYFDPPYLHATRRDLDLYQFELDDAGHHRLIQLCQQLPCRWALSGYRSAMYDEAAASSMWYRTDYQTMTRRGVVTESLWTNFQPAAAIAEFTYAGSTFRDRERIKRKVARWSAKFAAMPELERRAILASLTTMVGDRHE